MTLRSIDIALAQDEVGDDIETIYENVCTLTTDPGLCFNYATTGELKDWGFLEACFSCFLRDKKDVVVQAITAYQNAEGAGLAYNADINYLKKNDYGMPVKTKKLGDSSILLKKKRSDGITYNLLFFKGTVFAAISTKYKADKTENIDHVTGLAEKIERKI